jgi:hypothetical protein
MSYSGSVGRRSVLILDTGPIRELVAYQAVYQFRFDTLRRELRHLNSAKSYRSCSEFLASFQRKMTSVSVVTELGRWIRDTRPKGQVRLWERVREEFENMGMDESAVKLLDMDIELVAKYGPTDVSLLEIAHRNAQQRPAILTLDGRLEAECRRTQISSFSLRDACLETIDSDSSEYPG